MKRHSKTFDLSSIASEAHRQVIWGALNACRYPFGRIRKNIGKDKKVPVSVTDLSRYAHKLDLKEGSHAHVHNAEGGTGHLLGSAERKMAMGLYWLPTPSQPAGAIEIHSGIMSDIPMAQEVFLAEAAHAVDYGVPLTEKQKQDIFVAYHDGKTEDHDGHGWFEEKGNNDYWSWVGESFMSGFMSAYAPKLPRPLEKQQPWVHKTTPAVTKRIRKVLNAS